jgi:hypothetical protein
MPYLGNTAGNRFVASKAATQFSGDGSTTAFTLDHAVGSDEDILVSVDGVIQEPSVAYAVSNGTTLTFTGAPSSNSGNNIFVYYLFRTVGTVDHPSTSALSATSGTFSTTLNVTGLVGIGNSVPSSFNGGANNLVVGTGSGSEGMSIYADSSSNSAIFFADGTSGAATYTGQINYQHASDAMTFHTNGGTENMRIDSIGAVTKPNQPAFLAKLSGNQTNITADGSHQTVQFDTEIFDQNADFNTSNYTFTAPVTGRYHLSTVIYSEALDTDANFSYITILTSNRNAFLILTPKFSADPSYWFFSGSLLMDMDASDTAIITYVQGTGAAQTDINATFYFSGYLVC